MALKKRERTLAIATAALLLLLVLRFLWSVWTSPGDPLEAKRDELQQKIEQYNRQIRRGREAEQQLKQWQQQSLPSNREAARSQYQNWLLASAESAGFKDTRVDASPGREQANAYRAVRFNLRAETTLADLTRFLHAFYSTPYLHTIQSLNFQPRENGKKVGLQASIEAIALPHANRTNRLPAIETTTPLAASIDQYTEAIAGRNLFAPFRTAEAPPPPPPGVVPVKHVYVTAILAVADTPEAWIVNRTSGECLKLHQGDSFRVGQHHGTLQSIDQHEVTIDLDGASYVLPLGSALESASARPLDRPASSVP